MKFATKTLKDVVKAAAALAPKKSTFADLENIKLHFVENALTVTGSDLNNAYEGVVYAISSEEYIDVEVLISAAATKYISSIKAPITEINLTENTIIINGCTFPRLSAENYPEYNFTDDYNYNCTFGIRDNNAAQFIKTVKALNAFTAKSESKPILCGINIRYDDDSIYMTAVDGYHAAQYKVPTVGRVQECNFTVNAKFADIASHLCGEIAFYDGKTHCRIGFKNGSYIIRKLDGEFFDIRRSFPNRFVSTLEIDVADMMDKVKNITSIAMTKDPHPIIFDFEENTISYKNSAGKMSANISGKFDGEKFRIGFNYKFLLDALKLYSGDITIKFSGKLGAALIDSGDIKAIILPVRLKSE